jgi:hypothetical protein
MVEFFSDARFTPEKKIIKISVRPRKGSAAICSRCHQPVPGYDQLSERRFEFIPLWGFSSKIVFVCSDMWEPYLKVIREKCSEALHILHGFHIVAKMNKALDEVGSRPGSEEISLVATQAGKEPRRRTALSSPRSAPLIPEDRPSLPPQRDFSAVLG